MARRVVSGAFTATGQSGNTAAGDPPAFVGGFNLTLSGTFVATVRLERSFDGGSTWHPCTRSDGSARQWAGPCSIVAEEPEANILYRLNCAAYTSGTVTYRLSQ